jgi:hypothetical protein
MPAAETQGWSGQTLVQQGRGLHTDRTGRPAGERRHAACLAVTNCPGRRADTDARFDRDADADHETERSHPTDNRPRHHDQDGRIE